MKKKVTLTYITHYTVEVDPEDVALRQDVDMDELEDTDFVQYAREEDTADVERQLLMNLQETDWEVENI